MKPTVGTCLLVAAFAVTNGCATASVPVTSVVTADGVRFEYVERAATSVALAGSFNGWSTSAHPLTRPSPSAAWTLLVRLDPGEHTFMFIVDGTRWVVPPAVDLVDDGFGSKNGLVIVGSKEK